MPDASGFAEYNRKKARDVHQNAPRFPLSSPYGTMPTSSRTHCARRGRRPRRPACTTPCPAPVGRGALTPPPDTRRTSPVTCHCEPARTPVWQTVIPLRRTSDTWENGFPRRFAPRNDIFTKIILFCVGRGSTPPACVLLSGERGGAEPPPLRMFCKFLCRAAPMCAAADMHRISIPCVGVGVPDDPFHRTPQKMPLRTGAHAGVANRPLFSPFHPKKQTPNYAKHKNPKTPCEEGYTMLK